VPRAEHWRAQIVPGGAQCRYSAYHFQVADDVMQMDIQKTLYPFYIHKENAPCFGNNYKNALRWQQ